jgi:L-fuculokinase
VLALPAFSDQGGPFASRKGVIEGPAPTAQKARAALATLYSALMTAHMLRRLEAPGDLIVEGGFARSPAFAAVLARLMGGRRVVIAPMSAGAAAGAAMLAHWSEPHPPPRLEPAPVWELPGLEAYRERWERVL